MRHRVRAFGVIALAISTVHGVSEAADSSGDLETVTVEASRYTEAQISSATKLTLSLRETPQSITVITRERLDDENLVSLRQVLDSTPGVYSYAYDTERVLFSSRGFPIDSLLYDGVPAVTNFNTNSVDDTLDTALYDRIEIVRGATGLMTGAGSPAASINVLRKHATSDQFALQVDASAGSWNDRRIETDLSTSLSTDGAVRARFVGVFEDQESYQNLYRKKTGVAYGVIDADVTPTTYASIGFDYQDTDPHGNTWGSFPLFLSDGRLENWPRNVTSATDWSFWDRRKRTVFAELRQSLGADWNVRATVNWRRLDENLALFYVFGYPDPQTGEGLEPFAYRSTARTTEVGLDLYVSGPFELFGRRHELVLGYNGSRVSYRALSFEPGDLADPGNFFLWDGSYPEPNFASSADVASDVHARQNGVYAATRLSLAERLKLIGGARYATWKTDYFALDESPPDGFHYNYSKTIPYAGLVYDLARSFAVFTSFTQIFKPQNSRDIAGRYLDPINGQSFEVGIKGEHFGGRLNTALTLFETRQNNVATGLLDAVSGDPVLLSDGTQASIAIDGTRTRGFELEGSGELRPGWNASLGWSHYSFQDANREPARTFIPSTLVRAFSTWNPPGALHRLTLGAGLNWQSASHTIVGAPSGQADLSQRDVTLVSLMARYEFTPSVAIQFNSNNLLDRKYYVLDEYDNTYYGPPASYTVGVTVRL